MSVFAFQEIIPRARSPPFQIHQPQQKMMNLEDNIMDKPTVGIVYKLANGKRIRIDVSIEVKELLEQSDRQTRSQGRQDRRHLDFVENVDELDSVHTQPQEDIADLINRMDSYKRLYSAIDKLSEIQRRRLLLHHVHKLTHKQIAVLEGVDQSAIGQSIKRAIEQLRKHLTK